jgi:proteic killer suppression protein
MIKGFKDSQTQRLFDTGRSRPFANIRKVALRKLDMINAATAVADLRSPPGNRLEALRGERKGQYSIRINDQWRICFRWTGQDAEDVEIVDYHD